MYLTVLKKIICLTITFMLVLSLIRIRVLDIQLQNVINFPELFPGILLASYYDWLFAILLSLFFISLAFFARNRPKILNGIFFSYIALVFLCVLFALLNIIAVHLLKGPLNYQWVYYSDFFGNSETRKGFLTFLSWSLWKHFLFLCLSILAGAYILNVVIFKLNYKRYLLYIPFCGMLLGYLIFAGYSYRYKDENYGKVANPVVSFVSSVFVSFKDPYKLFPYDFKKDPESFQAPLPVIGIRKSNSKIRNVIIYVLESVPAEYISGYDPKYKVTPNIESCLKDAIVFSDIYAHFPATNSSAVSILSSMYPMISYKCLTKEFPQIAWPTLSSELKQRNYQTAFFHASDNRFQRMDEFLSERKFDTIVDFRDMRCKKEILVGSTPTWRFLDGIDEECMVDTYKNWLDREDHKTPFFAVMWTIQTHYPYFPIGKEKLYIKENPDLNRYLNALHHSDAMFGEVIEDLKQRGLMDSTLVVIVGDHGEAFGSHNQHGHGAELYEENIKVPLLFIHPGIKGKKFSVIGGQVDLAPTIMDLLGYDSPSQWQGESLLNPDRINRAYFFNPHSYFLFGYREGKYKIVYNADWNETRIYDLSIDPLEQNNIAKSMPELVKLSKRRICGWVKYHSSIINQKIAKNQE